MSLDEETDILASEISRLTGEPRDVVVRVALEERLARERLRPRGCPIDMAATDGIVKRFNALPVLDTRTDDEILGYDENGLPS